MRLHRVRRLVQLRGELHEIGIGTEAARQHLMNAVLTDVGAVIAGLSFDVAGGQLHGIKAATLVGFDDSTMSVFAGMRTRGRCFNPVCRETTMPLKSGRAPGDMITASNAQVVDPREWETCEYFNEYVRPARVQHYLGSTMWFGNGINEGIGAMRAATDRPFTDEDCHVLHLMREGLGQMFREPVELAPRVREVLGELVTGAADKEIAARLGISPHTVRQYVKTIFRVYGVSRRAQLLARFATGKAISP